MGKLHQQCVILSEAKDLAEDLARDICEMFHYVDFSPFGRRPKGST